ncbi:MAG: hypothetical protein ACP5N1_01420 [Candidatus Woesearchaeota archaeon]
MIDYIIGLAFMPVSILMFLNMLGITNLEKIIGIPLILLGAIGLIVVQIVNIISSHIKKEFVVQSWILCIVMMWPSAIYLTSGFVTYPPLLVSALVGIIASFLFVEGTYSFYIDHESFK